MPTATARTETGTGNITSARPLAGRSPQAARLRGEALRRPAALAGPLLLACAVAVPVADRGGFTAQSRSLFVALAAIALSVALLRDERSVLSRLRAPVVGCLLALAALSIGSAAWTVGDPAAAVRCGMAIAAVAATAIVAAQIAERDGGVAGLASFLAGLAALEALLGLAFVGLRLEPFAERIGGTWRPGSSFEYPPALALLQVAALPALMRAMARSRPAAAALAAAGAASAGAVLALADSRTEAALALLVLAAALAAPAGTLGVPRRAALLVALVPVAAGLAAHRIAGGYAWPGATGGDAARILGLAVLVAGTGAAWALVRARVWTSAARPGGRGPWRRSKVAAVVAVAVGLFGAAAAASLLGDSDHRWVEPVSGFTHGRSAEWGAALRTALDRPYAGGGADAYANASAAHQSRDASLYAHDLPLETWAELGALGLGLVLALYASAAMLLWRIRHHPQAWLVGPAVAAFLLANLVDWPWHLAGAAAAWGLCLGCCLALGRPRQTSD